MSNLIQRSSFQSDLLPIINKWEGDNLKLYEPLYPRICEVESSDQAFEVDGVLMGMSTLQNKPEGEALKYDTSRQMYTPRYNHLTYALGFKITMEMQQDGSAMKNAKRFTAMLVKAASQSKDILAANILNNAYVSGKIMDGGDGVILASNAHPSPYGNQSNIITAADLSEASLETMYIAIRRAVDDRGIHANLLPRKLVVEVGQEPEAHRILKSAQRYATADNDANFVKDAGIIPEVVTSPFLTDLDQFSVLTDVMGGIKFIERVDMPIDSDNEFDTKNASFSKVIRVSTGWTNWRGAYFSAGV